jgi:PHD/YefM family antitoxin component YafN of YafNO toxin-antitoxin module
MISKSGGKVMDGLKERYLTDGQGKRVAVVLGIEEYKELLEALEELESIQAYDMAKASGDEVISLEAAIAEIEQTRRNES